MTCWISGSRLRWNSPLLSIPPHQVLKTLYNTYKHHKRVKKELRRRQNCQGPRIWGGTRWSVSWFFFQPHISQTWCWRNEHFGNTNGSRQNKPKVKSVVCGALTHSTNTPGWNQRRPGGEPEFQPHPLGMSLPASCTKVSLEAMRGCWTSIHIQW